MKEHIHIDTEFMRLSIPFCQSNMNELESSLINKGCLEPITVWQGLILDGYKRYQICTFENIDFEVKNMKFQNREEAIIWICRERISVVEKHSVQYRYLVGKWYICQKLLNKAQRHNSRRHEVLNDYSRKLRNSPLDTSMRMGEILDINHSTVEKCGKIASILDRIDEIEPMLFKSIMNGDVVFSMNKIMQMEDISEIVKVRNKFVGQKDIKMRQCGIRKRKKYKGDSIMNSNYEGSLTMKIKEMPKFDPDMSLRGLTLTIPMWISAIERAQQQTDMNIASENAKMQLCEMLIKLDDIIQNALEVL